MKELDSLYNATGKKFRLFYSGGIDSTAILAAFVSYYGINRVREVLEITCTVDSIKENPWAWEKVIRPAKFDLVSSYGHPFMWDDDVTFIQGECADLVMPGPLTSPWLRYRAGKQVDLAPELSTVRDYLKWLSNYYLHTECTDWDAEYASKFFIDLANQSPFKFETMIGFTWWITFTTTWQSHKVRSAGFTTKRHLGEDFFTNKYIQFYESEDFQLWSMKIFGLDQELTNLGNFKPYTKEYIIEKLSIPEYQVKGKFLSWEVVNHNRKNLAYITDKNEVGSDINLLTTFIQEDNSFI
jgi:hypothetical protein